MYLYFKLLSSSIISLNNYFCTIKNIDLPFWLRNWALIAAILIISIISNFLIIIYSMKIVKMKKQLQKSNEELTSLYQQITAADSQLKEQYEELSALEQHLRENEERYRLIVEAANDAIYEYNYKTNTLNLYGKWKELTGYKPDEIVLLGGFKNLIPPDDYSTLKNAIENHIKDKTPCFTLQYRIKTKNGDYRYLMLRGVVLLDEEGEKKTLVSASIDIDELKKAQENLHNLAYSDYLTKLPNRIALCEDFEKTTLPKYAVFLFDIDNMKYINDTMGHDFGDKFIIELSKRFKSVSQNYGKLYSYGGDEFLLVASFEAENDIKAIADSIIKSTHTPVVVQNREIHFSVTMGISYHPYHGYVFSQILMNADIAMYKAKMQGKGKYLFYNPSMHEGIIERLKIESHLQNALTKNEFMLYFQPQYDLRNSKITGFESLIRWNSPELGFIPPDKFIKIAEDNHFIIPLGKWVLEKSCEFIKKVHEMGYKDCIISVNISVVQILEDDFTDIVVDAVKNYGIDPSYIELEITESVLMESFEIIINKLNKLKNMGFKIALDDFGQGYSSLSYLQALPINTLKIDKSFIDLIDAKKRKRSITDYIVILGRRLGLSIVAEGVETQEQMNYLKKFKCNKIQGYYFSKPLPLEEALKIIDKNKG
ncbi:PAS domain S-box-containing protein/diguanylate cyclase (GGDEF) domain-containing protein [Caloramator quimbayensis]|uniref:PAS domain S-box-containing protein/diguanylate cyclase (GGDEF) domain-containing protein n=1 Tax=Caloramator quimbayensis TaxID=1147123 RepID=A0A1T4WMT7_9CLOT|nr:GGDEF domain-containing phosphodiesterase [Caloramator quimbayensis]SKA78656.1 PAS domain S-box-containing protein/diguanylate cyclase (GGDEF) domain-containing protein [Caloramator quimbayensis]